MMDDNQSISQQRTSHDFLSDLPLATIHSILALVPIRDAVRTCILSRQWRYKWASLPELEFQEDCVGCKRVENASDEAKVKNFITQVLFSHTGPVHKFKLSILDLQSCFHTDQWLLFLSRNDIKDLYLHPGIGDLNDDWFQMHSSVYSCQKLTKLKLFHCALPLPPPEFKGFLSLRHLRLFNVIVTSKMVESIVNKCPLLEKLILVELPILKLRICAPNLKFFCLTGAKKEISLYAPLLAEMCVGLHADHFTAKQLQQQSSVCNYTKLLGGFCNLEKFRGDVYCTKYLSIGIESCHDSLVFHRLKDLRLYSVSFQDIKEISVFVRLITGAPNLHKLKVSTSHCTIEDAPDAPPVSLREFGFAPDFTFEKLRVFLMKDVCAFPPEMEFIKFVLKNSPVLETIHVVYSHTLLAEELQNLTAELLRYEWQASSNVNILFQQADPP